MSSRKQKLKKNVAGGHRALIALKVNRIERLRASLHQTASKGKVEDSASEPTLAALDLRPTAAIHSLLVEVPVQGQRGLELAICCWQLEGQAPSQIQSFLSPLICRHDAIQLHCKTAMLCFAL